MQTTKVGSTPSFQILKDESSSQSRALKFKDDQQGINREFKNKIANMIAYKQYLEACQKKNQRLDPLIVDFFCDMNRESLQFNDKFLDEEHKVRTVLGDASLSQHHPKLNTLVLFNCALSDDSIESIIQGLISASPGGH